MPDDFIDWRGMIREATESLMRQTRYTETRSLIADFRPGRTTTAPARKVECLLETSYDKDTNRHVSNLYHVVDETCVRFSRDVRDGAFVYRQSSRGGPWEHFRYERGLSMSVPSFTNREFVSVEATDDKPVRHLVNIKYGPDGLARYGIGSDVAAKFLQLVAGADETEVTGGRAIFEIDPAVGVLIGLDVSTVVSGEGGTLTLTHRSSYSGFGLDLEFDLPDLPGVDSEHANWRVPGFSIGLDWYEPPISA